MKHLIRNCPICTNVTGEIFHTQKFELEPESPLPAQYDIVQCRQCGFLFADTPATQSQYDLHYQNFSKYEDLEIGSGTGTLDYDNERLEQTAQTIDNFLKSKNVKILDIGSGNGGLLAKLRAKGYSELYALDPADNCVKYMLDNNITAVRGSILDDPIVMFDGETFDVIILSHVLEHIKDLRQAFINVSQLIAEDGAVYIEVPDATRYKDFFMVPYYYFDIEHINHFSQRTMNIITSLFGFEASVSAQKDLKISPTVSYPAFYTFYFHSKEHDANELRTYIEMSDAYDTINTLLSEIIEDKVEIVIWGAGNFTKRLMATTRLKHADIAFFVDKDKNKIGSSLNGIEIRPPQALSGFEGTVAVASALYADDIVDEINRRFPRENIIILR